MTPKRKYLFVLTYGRSGSTLLSGILNSLPGYCIRGENSNALHSLYEFHVQLSKAIEHRNERSKDAVSPWFGIDNMNRKRWRRSIRNLFTNQVLCPEKSDRVVGFKEIRFSELEVPDFDGYIRFLRKTFEPCQFVVNHRNLTDVAASGWWKEWPEAIHHLRDIEARLDSLPSDESCFHFYYDRMLEDPTHTRDLFAFLGEEFDEAVVDKVLNTRHSF